MKGVTASSPVEDAAVEARSSGDLRARWLRGCPP